MREQFSLPTAEIKSLQTSSEIAEFFAVADPILHVDWGEDGAPEEYTPEYIAAHPDVTKVFVMRDQQTGEMIAGAKVKMVDDSCAQRLQLPEVIKNRKGALLEYTFVNESLQDNHLLDGLMKQRLEWAREQNATYVCTELGVDDPRAIWVKLRKPDNFVLIGVCPLGEGIVTPYFVAVRPVDMSIPEQWTQLGMTVPSDIVADTEEDAYEWDELPLGSSVEDFERMFHEGWRGVDLRGTIDQSSADAVPWSVVLERQKSRV